MKNVLKKIGEIMLLAVISLIFVILFVLAFTALPIILFDI